MIDSHCHIHDTQFDHDRNEVLTRAKAAGVEQMILIGNDHQSNQRLIQLLPQLETCKFTMGIHPHNCEDWTTEVIQWIEQQIRRPQLVGIGETGLDYFKNKHDSKTQETVFRAQIELAQKYNLPVVLHIRDAFIDAKRILTSYPGVKFIMHCFTGTTADVEWIIALGGYISLSGIITFSNAKNLQVAAKTIPLDRLLIETDSPYLAPGQYRGQRCEPAFLKETAVYIAAIKEVSLATISDVTTANAKTIFVNVNSAIQ